MDIIVSYLVRQGKRDKTQNYEIIKRLKWKVKYNLLI